MPDVPALRARDFGYAYPGAGRQALCDVTLTLAPGSFTAVAGESGSGKSPLLRAAAGLAPHFYGGTASGQLTVAGRDVRTHGPGELAAVCGTVFQDPEAQIVMTRVASEISLPLEQQGAGAADSARAVEEVALVIGIEHLLERTVDTLSGGELQRVALAAALVHRPELLLLDEPTSQLDPVAADELIWLLRRLNEDWGTAVLIAEHRIERCLEMADAVVALDAGRIVCNGPPGQYLDWAASCAPALAPPLARLFSLAGLRPLPASVREARRKLRPLAPPAEPGSGAPSAPRRRGRRREPAAVRARGVWVEVPDGPVLLQGIELALGPGELVALMGRNGAGKSTLLRQLKGLDAPTRGRVQRAGEVALLMQNPSDYLIHDHAVEEAGPEALAAAGLLARADAHPRDLSGGERQRLALEVVLAHRAPAAVCLDEPTRGMDHTHKLALVQRLKQLAAGGVAVIVATHDTDFAAEFAARVVLMGKGVVIADGSAAEVLASGWHFTTDVARALSGAGGALTAEQGAAVLQRELVA